MIAGQGTIALEMFEDVPDLDMLVIPIGGGGLIAGNAIAARALRPSIEIVGAEAAMYPSFWNALTGEQRPSGGPTLAEGIAVKNVGKLTLPIVRELVSEIVLVDEESIERAVNAYLTLQKTMAEGAGAAGLAAMLLKPERFRGRKVGLILCGGNIDPRILVDHHGARARARMPDRVVPACDPGSSRRAWALLLRCWANSAPTSSRSITAGCFSTCRPRAPSSTSPSRRAVALTATRSFAALQREGYAPVRIETATAME